LWYDFRDEKPLLGEQEVWTEADLSEIPIFVKAGAVLPIGPVMQYTGEKRVDSLELHLYYLLGRSHQELYQDSGEGYEYAEGAACLREFAVEGGPENLSLIQTIEGTYAEGYQHFQLHVHALPFVLKNCLVDGEVIPFTEIGGKIMIEVPASFTRIELS
jgi:alpha-glucosidase